MFQATHFQVKLIRKEKSKTSHINCNLFLRKEKGICFQHPNLKCNSKKMCRYKMSLKYPKTLYTLRLRTFSSIRDTTRKKSAKLTLNMGIPLYSKDKYQNKHVNILSLGREAHKRRGIEVKDYFNLLRFSILLNSQDEIVRNSVSLKRKQEQIHFHSLGQGTNSNELRELQAQSSR